MKQYAIFHMDDYYPAGGWDDLYSLHETLPEAEAAWANIKCGDYSSMQLVDLYNGSVLALFPEG